MIQALFRFHGYNAITRVYKRGKTVRSQYFSVRSAPSNRQTYRAAVVVSKKVSKSAVVRNRIRRRLYEAIRLQEAQMLQPTDFVVTVFGEQVASMPYDELQKTLTQLLKEAAILRS